MSKWERDKIYPTWQYHSKIVAYLSYDPFPSCGLRDPYGNEPPIVAILGSKAFGGRLRRRRLELRLTLTDCALRLGVSLKTLRDWERAKRTPCRKNQELIKKLDGVPPKA